MKKIVLAPLLLLLACSGEQAPKPVVIHPPKAQSKNPSYPKAEKPSVSEQLKDYFLSHETAPDTVIFHKDWSLPEDTVNSDDLFVSKHHLQWLANKNDVRIGIDGHFFSLWNLVTINEVTEHRRDSLRFVNAWKEVRLYRFGNREIIGIEMGFGPCTGTACSVSYYLFYDIRTREKSVFGAYASGYGIHLCNFGKDRRPDFVSSSAIARSYGEDNSETSTVYELYSMGSNGRFHLSESDGSAHFITHTLRFRYTTSDECIMHHWVEALPAFSARFYKQKRFPATPRFHDYPVEVYKGQLANPVFKGNPFAADKEYTEFIRKGCRKTGINFGGKYTILMNGCGAECLCLHIVDRVTGHIFTHIRPNDGRYGYLFREDSKLLWANSELFGGGEDSYYAGYWRHPEFYRWSGNNFTRLYP